MCTNPSQSMETVDSDIDHDPYCKDIPDEGTRKIHADIYRRLKQNRLSVQYLEKWKDYLDKHMAVSWCDTCSSKNMIEFAEKNVELDVEKVATDMERGHCECKTESKAVHSWKLTHLACTMEEYYPIVMYLLERKISGLEDVCFGDYSTLILLAVISNQVETLKLLIDKGADVNYAPDGVECPLFVAISKQCDKIVDVLLACDKINVHIYTTRGQPLLTYCIRNRHEYVEKLLQAGADPNQRKSHYNSPLNYSVQMHGKEMVKMLVKYGADVNLSSNRGDYPLYIALYTGNKDMVEILLDVGADPNIVSSVDDNPLILIACYDGQVDVLKLLLKYYADPNKMNRLGYTALHIAAWNGHLSCVQCLLKAGVAHDFQTSDFNTPLALAAHGGYLEVIKELLPLGCNVNNLDKDRDTPLHYAAYNGMTEAVELLISAGADPDIHNACKATPLWNAVYRGKKETVKLLLKANVVMECKSVGIDQHSQTDAVSHIYESPRSPLWVAIQRKRPEIALLLVSAGYDIYKEEWLLNNEFPEDFDNHRLRSLLVEYSHTPPKLISICRNYFRSYFRQQLPAKVSQMDLPLSLKSFLQLADLNYEKKSSDTSIYDEVDSDDDR